MLPFLDSGSVLNLIRLNPLVAKVLKSAAEKLVVKTNHKERYVQDDLEANKEKVQTLVKILEGM